jgi:hypothetical protein
MKSGFKLALLFVSGSFVVFGQDPTGRIYGNVTDATGAVIVEAKVTISSPDTGLKRELVTNEDGNYNAPKLRTGIYRVEVEQPGFRLFRRADIPIGAGAIAEINAVLNPGDITQVVNVEGAALVVDTTSGAVRNSIETQFVDQAPLLTRDSSMLVGLIPGAVREDSSGNVPTFSLNGVRNTSNNYTLNGSDNADVFNSSSNRLPPPDALQELTVQSNYSAEFGRGGGAAVIAITRSGTNTLHGSMYDYFRSHKLNANSFQNNATGLAKPVLKRHQLGFTAGGPVWLPKIYNGRNRTFFFFNYQQLKTPAAPYLWRRGGLTEAELAGDFSNSRIIPTVSTAAAAAPNSPFAGMAGQRVTDLRSLVSPTSQRWYRYFDIPIVQNSGDFTFVQKTAALNLPEATLRVDQSITSRNMLSVNLFYRNNAPDVRYINDAPERFQSVDTFKSQNYSVSDTWTITPSIVNQLTLGYNRIWETREARFGDTDYSVLGFAHPQPAPQQFIEVATLSPSFFNFTARNHKYEGRDLFDYRDTVSWVLGSHFMKAGAAVQVHNTTAKLVDHAEYVYGGGWLNNRAAEWLIGWPTTMCCASEPFYRPTRKYVTNFFFQDDWKVTRRLNLNLGVRWDPERWAYLKNDKILLFVPGAKSEQYPNFPPGVLAYGDSAFPGRSGRPNDMNNVAPRLGFAYRLDSVGRRVLRGGWGMFYDTTDSQRDGILLAAAFPFNHRYSTAFNHGYPGPEGWLNIFAYDEQPIPDFSGPADPATAVFNPFNAYGTYSPDNDMGFVRQWNLTYEHEFRPGWTASAAYIGNRGVGLLGTDFWNLPAARDASDNWNQENVASRRPLQEYRYQTRSFLASNAASSYHAAQFTVRARTTHFSLLSHYTYSRARAHIDGIWGNKLVRSNPYDLDADWAPPSIDRPHNLLVMPIWDIPLFRDQRTLAGKLLGGWTATLVFSILSGAPVNVLAAQNNTFVCQDCAVRPDTTGEPFINPNWRNDPNLVYINAGAFQQPADGAFGNLPRNALRWPYTKNTDLNVTKSFAPYERARLELRFEFYNIFNIVNFVAPAEIRPNVPNQLTMKNAWTGAPRNLQIGARISF